MPLLISLGLAVCHSCFVVGQVERFKNLPIRSPFRTDRPSNLQVYTAQTVSPRAEDGTGRFSTGFIDAAFCEKKLLKHSSVGGANECHQSFELTRLFLQTTHTCCLSILFYASCKELDLPISQGFRRIFQKGLSLQVIHVSYSSDNVNALRNATQDAPVAVSEFKPFGQVHHCF